MVPTSAALTVDDVVRCGATNAFGPSAIAADAHPDRGSRDQVVFTLVDALQETPLVASVVDPTFITGGSAVLHLTTFAPKELALDPIDQMTVRPAPPVRLELFEVQEQMMRLTGRLLPR